MPFGIVLIREVPEHWIEVQNVLKELSLYSPDGVGDKVEEFFNETKAVLLRWFRSFGWSDFIGIIWASNVESIKEWVIKFRDRCEEKIKEKEKGKIKIIKKPLTTTIICIDEGEKRLRKEDFKLLKESNNIEELELKRLILFIEKEKECITNAYEKIKNKRC